MAPKSITLGPRQWLCFTITVRLKNIFQVIYYLHFKFCFLASRSNMWQRLLIGREQSKKHCCYLLKLKASLTVLDRDKTDFFHPAFLFDFSLSLPLVWWDGHISSSVWLWMQMPVLYKHYLCCAFVCVCVRVCNQQKSQVCICTDHYIYSHGRRGIGEE